MYSSRILLYVCMATTTTTEVRLLLLFFGFLPPPTKNRVNLWSQLRFYYCRLDNWIHTLRKLTWCWFIGLWLSILKGHLRLVPTTQKFTTFHRHRLTVTPLAALRLHFVPPSKKCYRRHLRCYVNTTRNTHQPGNHLNTVLTPFARFILRWK